MSGWSVGSVIRWIVGSVIRGGVLGSAFAHTVPDDVDALVLSNGELGTADCAHSHGGVRSGVDLDWFGVVALSRLATDIEDVLGVGLTLEVDEVDDSFGVHGGLRLNAIVWGAHQVDLGGGFAGSSSRGNDDKKRERVKRNKAKDSCGFHNGNCDYGAIMYRVA